MFDRLREIAKRWDAMPVGPWRVDGAEPRWVVRDAHGRALLETADKNVAREVAASYEDMAFLVGEVKRARREAKDAREKSDDFLGKGHDGRITLATYTIASGDPDPDPDPRR
ncbi:MAG: hypothetical protein R3B40_08860 [Polyangiales bacterium]